jgi:uncharacterized protein (DUF952 family)/GNAT superfamily N-acetyltransferase
MSALPGAGWFHGAVIYHVTTPADWVAAVRAGDYRVSTRGRTLAEEGFLHASTASQVDAVAAAFFADVGERIVLVIDESRVVAPIAYEPVGDQHFPHIRGPLNLDAVLFTTPLSTPFDPAAAVGVRLLADLPGLIATVGELRWREWGQPPEPTDLATWVDITARESGRDALPVTWVAVDGTGAAIGAVALGAYELDELRDERTPWIMGMIVAPDRRGRGIGRRLLAAVEAATPYRQLWVATGAPAAPFYEHCGWVVTDRVTLSTGPTTILTRTRRR